MDTEYDVLIVGYGMLGNVAALLLADLGMSVAVVEKKGLDDILLAKSARIDDEVMLIFEQLGLMEEIQKILYPLKGTQIIDKKDRVLLELNQNCRSQFAPLMGFYQPTLQRILQQKARRSKNITVLSGCEVETFEQDQEKVDVYISTTGKQDYTKLSTSFMVVCNGQYSSIADFLEIDINDFNYHSSVLCVDTITEKQRAIVVEPYVQTICDAEFPVTRIVKDQQHQRWEFQIETTSIEEEQTPEKVRKLLKELSPLELKVESAFVYNFDAKIIDNWRLGRVLIAGDAAHIMPPYLGLGLSAGIKDVYNLSWKLNLIRQGLISLNVLDTYQKERMSNVQHLIKLNLWIKRLFQSSKLRWIKGFIPIIPKWFLKKNLDTSNQIKLGVVGKSKGAGSPIVSSKVATEKGRTISFNKALKNKFIILALGDNPIDALNPKSLDYLAHLGTQFIQLTTAKNKFVQDGRYAENMYDKAGKLEQWMKQHKAKFVIIRPDRMIYDFCANEQKLNNSVKNLKKTLRIFANVY